MVIITVFRFLARVDVLNVEQPIHVCLHTDNALTICVWIQNIVIYYDIRSIDV